MYHFFYKKQVSNLSSCCGVQFRGLVSDGKRIDDVSEISRQDDRNIGKILSDAMIGDAILGIIVGADFFTAVTRADLCETIGSLSGETFFLFHGIQARSQHRKGFCLILQL